MAKYNVLREEYHHHHPHQSNQPNQNEKLNQLKFIFRLFSLSIIIVILLGLLLLCLTIFFTKYFQLEHNYSIIPLELSDNIINNNDYGDNNNVLNNDVNYDSDDDNDNDDFNYNNYKNDNHNDNGFILINNQSIAADDNDNNNLNRKDLNTSHTIPYVNAVLDHDYNHGHFLNNNDSKMTNQSSIIMHHHHDQQQHEQVRLKRGVVSLASMIRCITRCNPLDYKDYGCYCGFQGEGYPIDQIDRCCYMHDICYENTDCNQALVYFVSYKWICKQNRRASCAYVINGNAKQNCAYQLCECDRKFAKCLSRQRCPKIKPSCREKRNIITSLSKLFI